MSVPVPGSMPLYEEIARPPLSSSFTSQEVMKIEGNEAHMVAFKTVCTCELDLRINTHSHSLAVHKFNSLTLHH